MFSVTFVLFFIYCYLENMCKNANELMYKQQICRQMSWYKSNKDLLMYDELYFE